MNTIIGPGTLVSNIYEAAWAAFFGLVLPIQSICSCQQTHWLHFAH